MQNSDLWLMELGRNLTTPLTFDSAPKGNVAWSPDNLRIGLTSSRKGSWHITFSKDFKTFTMTGKQRDAQGKPVEFLGFFEKQYTLDGVKSVCKLFH